MTGSEGIVNASWPATQAHENEDLSREGAADEQSSEQLMLAFADGDCGAFDALYRRHGPGLFRFVYRHTGRQAQAEEIYQDTWLRVINARRRYRPQAQFQTWLYRIAQHRVIDCYRKSRTLPLEAPEEVAALPQTDESTRGLLSSTLNRALLELPLEQRTTVLLHLERNMTLKEIADICGCGRETVKSRMRYATARLRKALGALYADL